MTRVDEGTRIRILCVDDHAVVREGVAAIIARHADMQVVALAANGLAAEDEYRQHHPDITLMDLRLPGWSGCDTIYRIRQQDPKASIIVLTMYEGDEDVRRAMEAGASAYLLKNTLSDKLIHTIRDVHALKKSSRNAVDRTGVHAMRPTLSPREEEVLRQIAQGLRNKEIGALLGIAEGTVEAHTKRIFDKLQVHDRTAALSEAIKRGIIHID